MFNQILSNSSQSQFTGAHLFQQATATVNLYLLSQDCVDSYLTAIQKSMNEVDYSNLVDLQDEHEAAKRKSLSKVVQI